MTEEELKKAIEEKEEIVNTENWGTYEDFFEEEYKDKHEDMWAYGIMLQLIKKAELEAELKGFQAGKLSLQEKCLKMKIIKDEFCQCGHSKKAHLPHQLDKNGGRCSICFKCDCYTWKGFEFVSEEEIKKALDRVEEQKIKEIK